MFLLQSPPPLSTPEHGNAMASDLSVHCESVTIIFIIYYTCYTRSPELWMNTEHSHRILNPTHKIFGIEFGRDIYFMKIFSPFVTDNTIVCGWKFEHAKLSIMYVLPRKHFFRDTLGILKRMLQKYKKILYLLLIVECGSWTNDWMEFFIKTIVSKRLTMSSRNSEAFASEFQENFK